MAEKTRYSDEELEEFREIINEKLALAKRDYDQMMRVLMNQDSNGKVDSKRATSRCSSCYAERRVEDGRQEVI